MSKPVRGKAITDKYVIIVYHPCKLDIVIDKLYFPSMTAIGKKFGHHRNVIKNYLKNPDLCKKKKMFIIKEIDNEIIKEDTPMYSKPIGPKRRRGRPRKNI